MSDITDNIEVKVVAERLKGHEELCRERQKNTDLRFDRIDNTLAKQDRTLAKHDRMFYFVIGLVVVTEFFDIDLATAIDLISRLP
ncbi:MAG: hypothetical protein MPJ82_00045 [Alphaproteobacteria bacterium]|nr:hypothetical protein [Alphaproteobacteria bacterium]MDA7989093.1 hypothetical protein [Alphaproteobacteria bacterium]MDA8008544.1 hypothetical protein [Alphaproteobacteria bacterium]